MAVNLAQDALKKLMRKIQKAGHFGFDVWKNEIRRTRMSKSVTPHRCIPLAYLSPSCRDRGAARGTTLVYNVSFDAGLPLPAGFNFVLSSG
jgi:hypothetical protein